MFIEDVQACEGIVFDDINEEIVIVYVSIIELHAVAVLLDKSIVMFNSGAEY